MSLSKLAYGGNVQNNPQPLVNGPGTFRLERGVPFRRRGAPVVVIPQFKANPIISTTTSDQPTSINSFTNTILISKISFPGVKNLL